MNEALIRYLSLRTVSTISRWAVPTMLVCITGLLKMGYDGFVGEFQKLRTELSIAVQTINDARKADLSGIDSRLNEQASSHRQIRDEQMARTSRIAALEETVKRNTAWIDRADATMTDLRVDVAAIRASLEVSRKKHAPPVDLGRIPMLWHF
jgi:chromosome segregation ATPase